jgi:TolB-like protein/class 3 adenylate cyclase/Tfp pilus assembly protein PilF
MASTRRLAAILAADVAGYSRLMGADEEGPHERLKAHLRELVDPKIRDHQGRTVKNTGDGLLAEFPSVVSAVRCAVEVQREMIGREPDVAEERRIRFRIRVNLGDLIAEEDDIYGDGVNIAARLEALAVPGGICISRVVRDQVRDRLDFTFEDMGEQEVKNIARPLRVYAWHPETVCDLPASIAPRAASISEPAVAPRLSIVVLPFANLSNDPEQQYFADGITEDLTSDLSRIAGMFVISRNTAFTYQGKRLDTKQIGRELGVRCVLEGSVRRSGSQVRVNAQLIDAETDAHLWAGHFDGETADIFALQDEITSQIANVPGVELIAAEAARTAEDPDALDYILRGRAAALMPNSRESYLERIALFEQALALDPRSVEAQSLLADSLVARAMNGLIDTAGEDLARAERLVDEVLSASPRYSLAHFVKARVLRAQNRWEEAVPQYEAALALDRNFTRALRGLAWCKLYAGSIDEVIPLEEQAIRLSPRDPSIGYSYIMIGRAHLMQSRTDEAIVSLEKGCSAAPTNPFHHGLLAAAYGLKGETARAVAELAEARRQTSGDFYSSIADVKASGRWAWTWGSPKARALFEATYFAGLRKAGMPEE